MEYLQFIDFPPFPSSRSGRIVQYNTVASYKQNDNIMRRIITAERYDTHTIDINGTTHIKRYYITTIIHQMNAHQYKHNGYCVFVTATFLRWDINTFIDTSSLNTGASIGCPF